MITSKTCTKCLALKPLEGFSKAPRGLHGRKASCKECDAARHAARYTPRPRGPRRAPLTPDTIKKCTVCKVTKTLRDFSLSRRATETTNAVYRSECKECSASKARKWFSENAERSNAARREWNLKNNYGLTRAQYDALLQSQGGVCAICGRPERMKRQGKLMRMPVDHDHKTGAVRGILCQTCNRAIGLLGDDVVLMRRAISYLLRAKKDTTLSEE